MTTKETDQKLWTLVIGLLAFTVVAKLVLGWWGFVGAVVIGTLLLLHTIATLEVEYDPSKGLHDYEGPDSDSEDDRPHPGA